MPPSTCAAATIALAAARCGKPPSGGDTQLKIHLARLVELEYLLVHRGGRGQSFEYELVFDGTAASDVRHLSGLIDIEALHGYDAERSALEAERSGSGRPVVGERSAAGRTAEDMPLPEENNPLHSVHVNGAENAYPRPRETPASYPRAAR